jgi:hypothetical protein
MLRGMRLFSTRSRPVHLGPFPLERLPRRAGLPDLLEVPAMRPLSFDDPDPLSLSHAMARYIGMFDLVRDGPVQAAPAEVPDDPDERARHLKAAATYFDCSMVGICELPGAARLAEPIRNPMVGALGEELERSQPKSFAAGMDMILADVLDHPSQPCDRAAGATPARPEARRTRLRMDRRNAAAARHGAGRADGRAAVELPAAARL